MTRRQFMNTAALGVAAIGFGGFKPEEPQMIIRFDTESRQREEIRGFFEKVVSVLDYPLPGPREFDELLKRICKDVAESAKITIDVNDYCDSSRAKQIISNIIELKERPEGQTMHLDFPVPD